MACRNGKLLKFIHRVANGLNQLPAKKVSIGRRLYLSSNILRLCFQDRFLNLSFMLFNEAIYFVLYN